jgi:hypothetical protein
MKHDVTGSVNMSPLRKKGGRGGGRLRELRGAGPRAKGGREHLLAARGDAARSPRSTRREGAGELGGRCNWWHIEVGREGEEMRSRGEKNRIEPVYCVSSESGG